MRVLGIESSCDETAAAVAELTDEKAGASLLSNVVASSMDLHVKYGGVVPEIAARSHIEVIMPVIQQALDDANCTWDDIDAIAVTQGAGLGGSLLIGVLTARTLAIAYNKPLYACNHVEGHVYGNFITDVKIDAPKPYSLLTATPQFPMLAIIVSGGHNQLAIFYDHFNYVLLGQTRDDAIGEARDKVAKMIGLPYPGGVSIDRVAPNGNDHAFDLPKAKLGARHTASNKQEAVDKTQDRKSLTFKGTAASEGDTEAIRAVVASGKYDFSFSGLKTATLRQAQAMIGEDYTFPSKDLPARLTEQQQADIAATFARVGFETIVEKANEAYEEFSPASVVIAGGVAASPALRTMITEKMSYLVTFPDMRLCTDNGAMIASLGCYMALRNQPTADPYTLDIAPNLSM